MRCIRCYGNEERECVNEEEEEDALLLTVRPDKEQMHEKYGKLA